MSTVFDDQAILILSDMYLKLEGLEEKNYNSLKPNIAGSGGDQNKLAYADIYHEMVIHAHLLKTLANKIDKSLPDVETMHLKILLYGILFKFQEDSFRRYFGNVKDSVGDRVSKLILNFLIQPSLVNTVRKCAEDLYDKCYLEEKIIHHLVVNQPIIRNVFDDLKSNNETNKNFQTNLSKKSHRPQGMVNKGYSGNYKSDVKEKLKTAVEFYDTMNNISEDAKEENNIKPIVFDSSMSLKSMFANLDKMENIETEKNSPNKASTIKATNSSLLRLKANIKRWQEDEVTWIDSICKGSFDSSHIDVFVKEKKAKTEKEEMIEIESKHLSGLLTHEEMVIARENMLKRNREKFEKFLEEKKTWEEQIEQWKAKEQNKILASVDHVHFIKERAYKAKKAVEESNKNLVADVKIVKETLKTQLVEQKQKELEKKCSLIKEIRALHAVVKTLNKEKIFDFTETSNIGSFCEMSLVELKERLALLKVQMNQELEVRKQRIVQFKLQSKAKELEIKQYVEQYLEDRKNKIVGSKPSEHRQYLLNDMRTDERIVRLRNKLEERRALRKGLVENR